MSHSPVVHPSEERVFLAACLAHIKRADGSQAKDWFLADTARRGAAELLRKYLASPLLSDVLTERAHAAMEDLRKTAPYPQGWLATQSQAERVLPVAIQLLYVLAST
ncbi:MAG TPA: hypothetical protein VF629_25025 [Hymenobacter sp.]|jgi:hypothetical protein|uniref:hypothetical protein n=1 Tax=Hymenobacter sp. TaxID=1898978 RepID=UPI002ED9A9C5